MFKLIRTLLATIGYLLFLGLIYFSFYPLKLNNTSQIKLAEASGCQAQSFKFNPEDLNDSSLSTILTSFSPGNLPQDELNGILKAAKSLSSLFGGTYTFELSFCSMDSTASLTEVQKHLDSRKKEFDSGTAQDITKKLNNIPFVAIPDFSTKFPSLIAKSSFCNQPLNHSDIYLISQMNIESSNFLVMYNIKLDEKVDQSVKRKALGNLIETGQYLKSKMYCK